MSFVTSVARKGDGGSETKKEKQMTTEKKLDSIISFNKKEMKRFHKKGDAKKKMQHYQALEIAYELKRNLNEES